MMKTEDPNLEQCIRRVKMFDRLYIPKNILKYSCDALFPSAKVSYSTDDLMPIAQLLL